jgi:amino acid adenylation domain-containing protein
MVLNKILHHLNNKNELAFFIGNKTYSYYELCQRISGIQQIIFKNKISENNIILLNVYDDIETYASVLAIWFSGATFVPINTKHAKNRNNLIENQMKVKLKLSSNLNDKGCVLTKDTFSEIPIKNNSFNKQILYILFTSGSTGIPKGVPISKMNLNSFILDFNAEYLLNNKDKFLQIYDLTFDASIHCYVLPLFLGASVYTVSPNKIKYLEAYKILNKHQITFAKFPPSVLTYLQPYFSKINLPFLKYSLLGGESLDEKLAKQWQKCVPKAEIHNVYGPTEATINTHIFNFTKKYNSAKSHNGIVSIGKTFGSNKAIVVDKNNKILNKNVKGELCLSGKQITEGYYKNTDRNKNSFIIIKNEKYYKTGDLVTQDDDSDFIFYGRIDSQIQVQGYRVELSEIEHIAKNFKNALNYAVVAIKNDLNIYSIFLFAEKLSTNEKELHSFLQNNLPTYMVPSKIISLKKFPFTTSGKLDYNTLKKIAQKNV